MLLLKVTIKNSIKLIGLKSSEMDFGGEHQGLGNGCARDSFSRSGIYPTVNNEL